MYCLFSVKQIYRLALFAKTLLTNLTFSSQSYSSRAITMILSEGKQDCYYIPDIETSKELAIEFRVTNTRSVWAGSNIDVAFDVFSPHGNKLVSVDKSFHGSYILKTEVQGDYKICVDNRRLSPGNKAIYLKIEVADGLKKMK